MFLSVQRATCVDTLDKLTQMLKSILEYSVKTLKQTLDFAELEGFVDPALGHLFTHKSVWEAVEAVFELSFIERIEIYEAFCNDISFEQHIDDAAYHLSLLSEKPGAVLSQLCNGLYDTIRYGIPPRTKSSGVKSDIEFSVKMLKIQYAQTNQKNGEVCPVCARELLFDAGEGEADHYFPRKKYPVLALHSYNILPICSDCNSPRLKHDKNPLEEADIGPGELRTVFLPYLRAAKPEIEFGVAEDHNRRIVMRPGPNSDEYTEKRIANMERLYQLGVRWSGILSHVYDDIMAELSSKCAACTTEKDRLAALRRTLAANAASTRDRRDFIKGVYCAWLQTKSDAELAEILLSSDLVNAAK